MITGTPFTRALGVAVMGLAVLGLAGLALPGCANAPDRSAVLDDLVSTVIVPAYSDFAEATTTLVAATGAHCDTPAEQALPELEEAVADAVLAWSRTEAVWLGPVMDRRSWAAIDWPVDQDEIDALLVDPDAPLDVDQLAKRVGADQRGLRSMEYLLGEPSQIAIAAGDDRRCRYLLSVAEVIDDESQALLAAWTTTTDAGPAYRSGFGDDLTHLDELVNDAVFLTRAIDDGELGPALGVMTEADARALVDGPLDLGRDRLLARIDGLTAALVGQDADSPGGLAPLLDDALVGRLRQQLSTARSGLVELDEPLRFVLDDNPESLESIRSAMETLDVVLSTELVAALGVTVGFSDADGDSG